ncbi:MAG: hypothetical protein KDD55_10185, partial [Bdellovibrionales bacterium]|nr:hypothetical protein [Bdellovibrionales bacterium]
MKEDSTTEEILQRAVDLLKNDQSDLGISSVLTKGQHSSFVQSLLSNESHDHEATELPPSDSEQETTGTSDLDVASQLESLLHRRNQEEPKEKESEAELDLSKELDVLAQRRTTTLSPELVARLVAGAEEEPEHSPIEDPPIKLEGRLDFQISSQTSSPEVLPLENEEVAGSEKGSFEKLAKEKQWNELTEHAAQLMQREDGSALEARIWWIRGQFEERSVPLSILAAPLHGAIESLLLSSEDHPQIEQEAKALCLSLSKKLHKAGEYVLSLSLAERAIDLCTRSLETTSQKEKLETLSQATTEEHQRVYKHFHRTATDVIASLSSVPEYKRTESQGEELKRLQALLDGIAPRGPEKKSQAVVMDIPEVLPTHMPGKAQTDSWSQYRSLFLLLLGIVCGGAVWRAGVIQDAYAWITAIPQGSIETVLQIEAPSLSSPEARRRLTDKLDAIESLLQKVDYV